MLQLIKEYEAFSSKIYDARAGAGTPDWTIGWGHKLYEGTTELNSYIGREISKEEGDAIFKSDIDMMLNTTFRPFLKNNNIALTQNQFDAMLLFIYQFGQNTFSEDDSKAYVSMRELVRNNDWSEVAVKETYKKYMGTKALPGTIARLNDGMDIIFNDDYKRDYNYDRLP